MRTLLLWDIDGTILRSGGAGMRAMAQVAARLFGDHFRWDGIDPAGNLDPVIFHHAARINGLDNAPAHHDRFQIDYLDELSRELERSREHVKVMPGILETLVHLVERSRASGDPVMGLLTGNYAAAAPIKLRAVGVDPNWFEITAFGDEADTRPALVELAMKKFHKRHGRSPDPRRVIVIGDTPRDIACAHAHGCVAFAVATGKHSVEDLRAAGADHAVRDLADATPLLRLLD